MNVVCGPLQTKIHRNLVAELIMMINPVTRIVEGLASKLAYHPPTPAFYTVEERKDGTGRFYIKPVDR